MEEERIMYYVMCKEVPFVSLCSLHFSGFLWREAQADSNKSYSAKKPVFLPKVGPVASIICLVTISLLLLKSCYFILHASCKNNLCFWQQEVRAGFISSIVRDKFLCYDISLKIFFRLFLGSKSSKRKPEIVRDRRTDLLNKTIFWGKHPPWL